MVRWDRMRRSENVEDRRGRGGVAVGGGVGLIVVLVIAVLFGADPRDVLRLLGGGASSSVESPGAPPSGDDPGRANPGRADPERAFVASILGSTEDAWSAIFAERGARYEPPALVLFDDAVRSACGFQSAATGPFYCPGDATVYLDLGFFRELAAMGGPGDFAAAYVIGHEVGHHVQNLAGASGTGSRGGAGSQVASVRLELQADCYAGVWAARADRESAVLEPGDVEEGLGAAAAIGDDRLQRRAGRAVQPETFTHGTSAQRQRWLSTGLESGRPEACDTSAAGVGP